MIGIYKITNPNDRVYIGQSVNIEERFKKYYNLSCSKQPRLYRSLKKYGIDCHTFEVIEECSSEELNNRERYHQELCDVLSYKGMNCVYVNDNNSPKETSIKTKDKISQALKGRKLDKEHVEKIKIALSKRVVSENVKTHIGSLYRGKKLPEELIEKMRNTKLSQNLISEKRIRIKQFNIDNIFINEYNSIQECSEILNICRPNIIKVLKSFRKTAGGFKFSYSALNKLDEFRETPEVDNPELSL